ncbi:Mevalonate kinase [Elasticomyces elasticus]|uniref:Mevalonate kinase n=1 Tax=Exophiala sideris TaxID=1016849 RepID=A0ABR0J939_9EURO|nr:Mevalonate kinase [Elasticomyces elasticus]KAK5029573.1 Mevalonate kinase [Exophiala sideris]KAK5036734.1 Mevalonate kinase [Exophiala sideris]KAK5058202.1 Mevalonate kinase [Exophiala sideris]KAK5182162.1 Mevalonate kinase [Eurotiomycetes sp. CCFEE 6388]
MNRNTRVNGVNGHSKDASLQALKASRRASSPMAPPFMTSAPGKVIVFGEHAVVHGKAAMAAAISLRSYLLVTTLSKSQRTITLTFPDIGLDHTWNINDLPWHVLSKTGRKPRYYDMVTTLDPELVHAMQPHIDEVSPNVSLDKRKVHQAAASAFLYLFLCLSAPTAPACIYTLRSTLPIGAGLGSSASICVCISAALLKQIHVLSGPHHDQPEEEVDLQLERINKWAFVGELCIHGNPSGVDNTVATRGRAVLFRRVDYSKPPTATPLKDFPELPLLLVNTKQPRSTQVEVAKVGAMKKKYPAVTEATLDSIDEVTISAHSLITSDNFDPASERNIEHLGDLFRINHGLLVSLGVSHPKLEHIRELVDYADIGWTKLTGAGGGGCAITLLKRDVDDESLSHLMASFEAAGFEEYKTTLGGSGVGILYPAVLRNGSDEEGGDEIDQQKFLNAEGEEGIEALVGVGLLERRPEWKFWQ